MSAAPPPLKERARRALPYTAISGVLQLAFSLVGMLLLVRYLSPDDYGVWMVLLGFAPPLVLLVSVGHLQALLRFMPGLDSLEAQRRMLWQVLGRRVAWGGATFTAVALAFPLLAARFDVQGQAAVFAWMVPGFVALVANDCLVAALNVAFRQRDTLIALAVYQVGFVAGTAAGIVFGAGLVHFAIVYTAAALAQTAVATVGCLRHFGAPRWSDLRGGPGEERDRRAYRLTSYVDEVGTMMLSSPVNRLVLAALATTGQVAMFAVASNVVDRLRVLQPLQIFRPLATVSLFSHYEQTGSLAEVNRMFRFIYVLNRSVLMLYLVLFVPLGEEVLTTVFRPEYADAYWPAVLLFFALAVFSMPVGMVAQTLKRPQALVWSKAAVLLHLGLGIPLTLRYGAIGMAFAAGISSLAKNVITLLVLRLEFDVRFPWGALGRYGVAGVLGMAAIEAAGLWTPWFVAAPIGVVVYGAAMRALGVLDASERALLVSLLPGRAQGVARRLVG